MDGSYNGYHLVISYIARSHIHKRYTINGGISIQLCWIGGNTPQSIAHPKSTVHVGNMA